MRVKRVFYVGSDLVLSEKLEEIPSRAVMGRIFCSSGWFHIWSSLCFEKEERALLALLLVVGCALTRELKVEEEKKREVKR